MQKSQSIQNYNNPVTSNNVVNLPFTGAIFSTIQNNPNAHDPTYAELIAFLKNDTTDNVPYIRDKFVCADYAVLVHDNAEASGIRAGVVSIDFMESNEGHAINVFNTTDKGLVFIDCTNSIGSTAGDDKIISLCLGQEYIPESIFNKPKTTVSTSTSTVRTHRDITTTTTTWYNTTGYNYSSLGTVDDYQIYW